MDCVIDCVTMSHRELCKASSRVSLSSTYPLAPLHTLLVVYALKTDMASIPYLPGETMHLRYAINVCRQFMDLPKGRESFKKLAVRFSLGRLNSWYLQGSSRMTMDEVSNFFIETILVNFPVTFVDYGMKPPDNKAFHTRRPVEGDFEPGHQAISINGNVSGTFMGEAIISLLVNHLSLDPSSSGTEIRHPLLFELRTGHGRDA